MVNAIYNFALSEVIFKHQKSKKRRKLRKTRQLKRLKCYTRELAEYRLKHLRPMFNSKFCYSEFLRNEQGLDDSSDNEQNENQKKSKTGKDAEKPVVFSERLKALGKGKFENFVWREDLPRNVNEDNQRDFEEKFMRHIEKKMNQKFGNSDVSPDTPTTPRAGIYFQLESEWKKLYNIKPKKRAKDKRNNRDKTADAKK